MQIKNDKDNKNIYVELLRIVLTVVVCLHHFRCYSSALPYGGGYLGVDCFFIISGFYTAKHLMKNNSKIETIGKYFLNRYLRLLPDYLLAFGIALISRMAMGVALEATRFAYIKEAFMVEFWHMDIGNRVNPPDWYCGYLLVASVFLYIYIVIIEKNIKKNKKILLTVSTVLFFYIGLAVFNRALNIYPQKADFFSLAIIRAVAGMLFGCLIYLLEDKICDIINRISNIVIGCILLFSSIGFLYILLWNNFRAYIDYMAIILFACLFCICIGIQLKWKKRIPICDKIIICLGNMSYVVYLNHYLIAFLFAKYNFCRNFDWKFTSVIFLCIVWLFSFVVFYIGGWFKHMYEKVSINYCKMENKQCNKEG